MIRFLALLTVFILFNGSAQAQMACTQMWCAEGFEMSLSAKEWPTGQYIFEIEADGQQTTCRSSLPFKSCNGQTVCDGEGVTIGESGCAMSPDTHSFHSIMMRDIPTHVSVTITHGSGKSFSHETTVEKQCGFPNGKQCDPKPCCSGRAQVEIFW